MAEDNVQANIRIGIDTSDALASIKNLQRQISAFHTSMANGSAANAAAAANFQKTLIDNVNATKKFSASVQTVKTTTETFTNSLEKNKLSLGQYFRYAGGASKSFGRLFATEFETINKVARERVKDLQTQYIKLGRDANGAMKAIAVRPLVLDMDNLATKTAIAAQRQQLLNQLLKQGSTNLLNFGKNTQWAGRQLMVGFTIPLSIFGSTAAKSFMTIEDQAIRFRRVYGDLMTDTGQTEAMLNSIKELASEFTKYGVAVDKTMGLAASAAAQGKTGADLTAQVAQATRLSVLGQVEQQQALETTISVTNAFGVAAEDLASKIDFLNAVENQTVTSIEDLTIAIPKAGPVVKQLGGDVEDLAFFLTAMKEGGINASEGANALKSGLASLINPTEKASEMLAGFGINIRGIVESNKGDVKGIVTDFATSLDKLDPLKRARAIEQLFGKFQFSRLSTLFQNVIGEGTQAQKVLELAATSSEGLAALSERELGKISESSMFKFKKSIEDIKVALAPIGETFLKLATPVIEFGTKILNAFNSLDERTKNFVAGLVGVVGGIGPILLMTFGLLANGIANIIKGFTFVKNVFNGASVSSNDLGSQISYMTSEQLKAAGVAASLDQVHGKLTQTFTAEANAIGAYVSALQRANTAAAAFNVPAVGRVRPAAKMAKGGMVRGPGGPTDDLVPTDLSNGEAVIDAATVKKNPRIIGALFAGKKIQIPGYAENNSKALSMSPMIKGFKNATMFLPESMNTKMGASTGKGVLTAEISAYVKQAADAGMSPLMATMAQAMGLRLNDPKNKAEFEKLGKLFADSASTALETSGKQFVKDQDLEDLVVPALKKAAEGISVGGKSVSDALNRTLTEIRTAAAVGTQSGSAGALGRINLGGSYKGTGGAAKKYALATGNELFKEEVVPSKSRGTKKSFRTLNPSTGTFETATMAHIQKSVNMTVEKMKAVILPYLGDKTDKLMKAIGLGVVDGVKKSTNQASPSKEAFEAGENIGKGAIQGIESQVDDAQKVARKSRRVQGIPTANGGMSIVPVVGQTSQADAFANTPQSRVSRRATRPADLDVRQAQAESQDDLVESTENVTKANKENTKTVGRFGSATTNAILGVTSISYALSGVGGPLGDFAARIGQLSGVLYGLSFVTEMLTKQKILETLITRKNNAVAATRAAFSVADGAGLFARAGGGFFKNLATNFSKFSMFFKNFVGISLRFAGIVGLVAGGLMLLGDAVQKQVKKQNEYADALRIPKQQTQAVASFFGVAPKEGQLRTAGKQMVVTPDQRTEIKSFAASEEAKGYASQIDALKSPDTNATMARNILSGVSVNLQAQGVAEEQINSVLTYLQEEAGRKDLNLKFKSFDLTTQEGTSNLQKRVASLSQRFASQYAKGFYTEIQQQTDKYGNPIEVMVKKRRTDRAGQNSQKAAKELVEGTVQSLDDLSIAFKSGVIDSKTYNKEMLTLGNTLKAIKDTEAFDEIFKNLSKDNPTAELAIGLKDVNDQMLVLQALNLGLGPEIEAHLNALKSQGTSYDEIIAKATARAKIEAIIAGNIDTVTAALKKLGDGSPGPGGGTPEETPFSKALKQIKENTKELNNQIQAFRKLKAAGYETEKAFTIAKDPILAAALAAEKVGSKKWKELTAAIKKADKAAKDFAKVQRQTLEGATKEFDDSFSNINEAFSALEEGLRLSFDKATKSDNDLIRNSESQIAGLEYVLDDLNSSLDELQLQEDAINEKYDKRLDALDKVQRANEEISRQQKAQLSIADALSQGDISAAAKAIQDVRAEDAQASIERQRTLLEGARSSEISGLRINGKTRAQIDKEVLSLQKQIRKIEEDSLEPARERVRLQEERLQKDIDSLVVAGKTRVEWDTIANNIRVAKTQTDDFVKSLNDALSAAKNLVDVLRGLGAVNASLVPMVDANITPAQYAAVVASAKAESANPNLGGSGIAGSSTRRLLRMSSGGMVPKYFAAGGFAKGTDTVPSMLTPGEFVVKKYAVQDFGVDKLKAINNGTYSGESVYNYELNINVKSDANADDIARTVMTQIKQIDSQRLRGNRL